MTDNASTILDAPRRVPQASHGWWSRALRDHVADLIARARVRAFGGAGARLAREPRPVAWPRALAAVLVALAAHANAAGEAHPTHATLARLTGFTPRHVARVLDEGEAAGLLVRSVPSYGARVLGDATHYGLPWWPQSIAQGLALVRRARAELPVTTDPQAASLARALEEAAPAALLGHVARLLPAWLQRDVARTGVGIFVARAERRQAVRAALARRAAVTALASGTGDQETPCPDKRSGDREEEAAPSLPLEPSRGTAPTPPRGPGRRTLGELAAAALAKAREGKPPPLGRCRGRSGVGKPAIEHERPPQGRPPHGRPFSFLAMSHGARSM